MVVAVVAVRVVEVADDEEVAVVGVGDLLVLAVGPVGVFGPVVVAVVTGGAFGRPLVGGDDVLVDVVAVGMV